MFLVGNGGGGSVTRSDDRFVGERENFLADAVDELGKITAPQVGAADAAVEDSVTAEQQIALRDVEGQTAWAVTGDVQHLDDIIAQR